MQIGYLELKLSWELFKKAPETLSPLEQKQLGQIAARQTRIEHRILASPQAAHVIVPAATLAARLAEICRRYEDRGAFIHNLERVGLKEAELEEAIERDLRVEAILEKVASDAAPAGLVDAEIYYHLHPAAFDRPEARRLRHILLTSDSVAAKAGAAARLESLRATLAGAENFGRAALRYSQCPTALEGGQLGAVKRGQLYPELEAAAFALADGETSAVLESPVGLHILRCDEILPSGLLPFAEVCERIVRHLTDRHRQEVQKVWIKDLPGG
ncbi:MAG: nitrogen fixation protein NifM [Betaproteobacteria bacterium]|nr:nitrogen fixation protein NifM [Betaproteobacteria bacterium]